MVRAPCCDKEGLKKGRWTDEEDDILTRYIQANGEGTWRSVPKNAGLQRCGKSCRLRWINYLRPDLKRGNITAEEELVIIKLHASMGNRWSLIAGHLPGRTDNEIKNYWNSHLSRKIMAHPFASKAKAVDPKPSSELTADWKPRKGRSRQLASRKNSNRSTSTPENEELELVTKDERLQADATTESFEITECINNDGEDNTASLDADDSYILSSAQKPGYFTEDPSDVLCSLDDSLNMKVEETEVSPSTHSYKEPSEDYKNGSKVSSKDVDTCATGSRNDSKGLSLTSSAVDAWADWDWNGLLNCYKLLDEDEMLSMLWDDGSNLKCKNYYSK